MIFASTQLAGAWILDVEERLDERGFFARMWCQREAQAHALTTDFVQANLSQTSRRGTIRGLHYQVAPCREVKLVRCVRGAIWDVIVDLRPASATYLQWVGIELTAENHRQLYVPEEFAHGYQTLVDDTEVFYSVSQFYSPTAERGIRWNDPVLAIAWPAPVPPTLSEKDRQWPDLQPERASRPVASLPTDSREPS